MSKIITMLVLGCGLLGFAINGAISAIGAVGGALIAIAIFYLIDRIQ